MGLTFLSIPDGSKQRTADFTQRPAFFINMIQVSVRAPYSCDFLGGIPGDSLRGFVPEKDFTVLIHKVDPIMYMIDNI